MKKIKQLTSLQRSMNAVQGMITRFELGATLYPDAQYKIAKKLLYSRQAELSEQILDLWWRKNFKVLLK